MKVLIACEESQTECKAFREKGHEAYSCDIQECSGGHEEWHIKDDVLKILRGGCFITEDGEMHHVEKWDLVIAHPPCTYLTNAGACRLYKVIDGKSYIERDRFVKGMDARKFFMEFYNYGKEGNKIAIENPVPSSVYMMPRYTQIVQPYEHGDPYSKRTCLWLFGLDKLKPTKCVKPICSWVSGGSKKADGTKRENCGTVYRDSRTRSKTFVGIAEAMANQWG